MPIKAQIPIKDTKYIQYINAKPDAYAGSWKPMERWVYMMKLRLQV